MSAPLRPARFASMLAACRPAGGRFPATRLLRVIRLLLAVALPSAALLAAPATGLARQTWVPSGAQPEAGTGFERRNAVTGTGWMAVTANRHASEAAAQMLASGGRAIDAAVAAQMVLTLVEPQSSGIGGGGFMLHYAAASQRLEAWDGRETAPAATPETLWLDAENRPRAFLDAVVGGRSVGVPGLVRMLEQAHARHGSLPWARLFDPAITLARKGFEVSPRLHALLERDPALRDDPPAASLYYDEAGRARAVGERLRNLELADSLEAIARLGSAALHEGPIAREIVARVRSHPRNPGLLDERDLAAYTPILREPVCIDHGEHRICGMPPPSAGGIAVAQILKLWSAAPARLTWAERYDPDGVHRFAEAGKLAFADRDRYLADLPDTGDTLAAALLDGTYLAARARLIGPRALPTPVESGRPDRLPDALREGSPRSASLERPSTTHLSIVDREGNLVALTSSIESAFGARLMVRGFLLNNQLTDFSFAVTQDGRRVANRPGPGKRPRSSMAPTIAFDRQSGVPRLVIGSPGGSQIIPYVARSLIAILDEGVDPQAAIELPNLGNRNGATELERGLSPPGLAESLRARGHAIDWADMTSGLHAILLDCSAHDWQAAGCRLTGAVDPRREGAVVTAAPTARQPAEGER